MRIQEGPLAGVKGVQTTIGEYTLDDNEPVPQEVYSYLVYTYMLCTPLVSTLFKAGYLDNGAFTAIQAIAVLTLTGCSPRASSQVLLGWVTAQQLGFE